MRLMTLMRLLGRLLSWPDKVTNPQCDRSTLACFIQILYIHFDLPCLINISTTGYQRRIILSKTSNIGFYNMEIEHFESVVSFAIFIPPD